jgi:hypothetical protein
VVVDQLNWTFGPANASELALVLGQTSAWVETSIAIADAALRPYGYRISKAPYGYELQTNRTEIGA